MSFSINALSQANAKRWSVAKLTRASEYKLPVAKITAAQNRYENIQSRTGVDWRFVACTHYRESDLNFNTQLGQGDPLNRVSVNVPKGRGPFSSFEDGAYDALVECAPYAARIKDWSLPGMLTVLEMYNGLGYAKRGQPSPYVWSGTDQYTSGKYIRDGVYDPHTVDRQLGVAGLITLLPATQVPKTPTNLPTGSVAPPGPILNKAGEDISTYLHDFFHEAWQWLKEH